MHPNHRHLPVFPHPPLSFVTPQPPTKKRRRGKERENKKEKKKAHFVLSTYSLDMVTSIVASSPGGVEGGN